MDIGHASLWRLRFYVDRSSVCHIRPTVVGSHTRSIVTYTVLQLVSMSTYRNFPKHRTVDLERRNSIFLRPPKITVKNCLKRRPNLWKIRSRTCYCIAIRDCAAAGGLSNFTDNNRTNIVFAYA